LLNKKAYHFQVVVNSFRAKASGLIAQRLRSSTYISYARLDTYNLTIY